MLHFQNVSFSYEKKKVIDQLSFSVSKGEILAVMGPSGCGKTTLLSLAAGIKKPCDGKIISNADRISFVFQEPRLFPWMNVEKNLRAVLPDNEVSDSEIAAMLKTLGLEGCASLYPHELSGGMKSRVSLARALLFGGDLLLLDEPFSALDEELRIELSRILKQHLKEHQITAILVTHQPSDAQRLADRIMTLPASRQSSDA